MFESQHTEGLKWDLIWQDIVEAVFKSEKEYFPIPTVVVPVIIGQIKQKAKDVLSDGVYNDYFENESSNITNLNRNG